MDAPFEQASLFLEQAILSYSDGQIEEACHLMAEATTILHEIELAPPSAMLAAAAFQPVTTETAEDLPAVASPAVRPPAPAEPRPVELESERESSLAVAA